MHKEMHKEAPEQEGKREVWCYVLTMVGEQVDSRNYQESEKDIPRA
jgi:endo-1,4-beta-D-glucanase Y